MLKFSSNFRFEVENEEQKSKIFKHSSPLKSNSTQEFNIFLALLQKPVLIAQRVITFLLHIKIKQLKILDKIFYSHK